MQDPALGKLLLKLVVERKLYKPVAILVDNKVNHL